MRKNAKKGEKMREKCENPGAALQRHPALVFTSSPEDGLRAGTPAKTEADAYLPGLVKGFFKSTEQVQSCRALRTDLVLASGTCEEFRIGMSSVLSRISSFSVKHGYLTEKTATT